MDFWTITTLFPHFNPFLIHLYSLQDTNLPVDGFCQHQDSLKCKPSHPQCWLNDRPPKCRSSTSSSRRAASPATPLQVRHLDQFKTLPPHTQVENLVRHNSTCAASPWSPTKATWRTTGLPPSPPAGPTCQSSLRTRPPPWCLAVTPESLLPSRTPL